MAFAGLIGSLIVTLAVATRLDHLWQLLRRAAGHDQRDGVLGRIFMVTAIVAAAGFTVWFLLLEGPALLARAALGPRWGFRDYYRQFEAMAPEEISQELLALRDERRGRR